MKKMANTQHKYDERDWLMCTFDLIRIFFQCRQPPWISHWLPLLCQPSCGQSCRPSQDPRLNMSGSRRIVALPQDTLFHLLMNVPGGVPPAGFPQRGPMSPLISQGVVFCTRSEEQPPGAGRGTFLLFLRLELSCLVESFLTLYNGLILICGDDFYPVH